MKTATIHGRILLKYSAFILVTFALHVLFLLQADPAKAQADWKPNHSIRLFIQFAAGGGTDVNLRTLAKGMEEALGQQIVCTNMTGGLGAIAANFVYEQPPDGYTLLGGSDFSRYLRIMDLNKTAAWRDWQYFQSASSLASWSVVPDSPIKSFQDLIRVAKEKPETLRVSTDGKGGLWAEAMNIVADAAGFTFKNIAYDGGAPATLAALQKEVDVAGSGLHEQIEFIKAGKLRNLAVFSDTDIDVPGVGVLKAIVAFVPGTKSYAPFGGMYNLALKRDTPKPVLMTIKKAFLHAVDTPAYQDMLSKRFMKRVVVVGTEADKKGARLECGSAWLYEKLGIGKVSPEKLGLPKLADFDKWWPPKDYKPSVID